MAMSRLRKRCDGLQKAIDDAQLTLTRSRRRVSTGAKLSAIAEPGATQSAHDVFDWLLITIR